jgi:predicted Zn-dependent protease
MVFTLVKYSELEADYVGYANWKPYARLLLMKKAGYDIDGARRFWLKMSSVTKGGALPSILSTHPSSSERFRQLTKHMKEMRE